MGQASDIWIPDIPSRRAPADSKAFLFPAYDVAMGSTVSKHSSDGQIIARIRLEVVIGTELQASKHEAQNELLIDSGVLRERNGGAK